MASTPTRNHGVGGVAGAYTSSYGNMMLSPKLAMNNTASPAMTRLDRVLDLVTEHEAHFREQELRVVDISKRVANVEARVKLGAARYTSRRTIVPPYLLRLSTMSTPWSAL